MKKIFLLLLLPIQLQASSENWVLMHNDINQKKSFYVELGDFQLVEGKTRMWVMESYGVAESTMNLDYRSIKSLIQVDCNKNTMRIMGYALYETSDATGQSIFSKSSALEWEDIKVNSVNSEYRDIACQEAVASPPR
mgnify:FL=1|jgi:hypothetical protein